MSRFLQAALAIFIFVANLAAQSPTPRLPAQTPLGPVPQSPSKSPALPAGSPSTTSTTEDVVNSLAPADLQAVITLLKSNFVTPGTGTDRERNRAPVQALMARLQRC